VEAVRLNFLFQDSAGACFVGKVQRTAAGRGSASGRESGFTGSTGKRSLE